MEYNYHTHTPLCGHATGEMREYIEKAIEGGIKRLGFSDHSVQFYDGGYVSGMRMRPDQAEGYVREVKRLSEEYRSEIDIFVGFDDISPVPRIAASSSFTYPSRLKSAAIL